MSGMKAVNDWLCRSIEARGLTASERSRNPWHSTISVHVSKTHAVLFEIETYERGETVEVTIGADEQNASEYVCSDAGSADVGAEIDRRIDEALVSDPDLVASNERLEKSLDALVARSSGEDVLGLLRDVAFRNLEIREWLIDEIGHRFYDVPRPDRQDQRPGPTP